MSKIKIVDTTLRDGEQTAGVVFANHEKIRIAKMLDAVGVDQIEAGVPVMGGHEKESIKEICKLGLKASIMGWNRAVIADIEQSLECGVDAVAISISTSDIHIEHKLRSTREKVLESMVKATEFAHEQGVYISVNAEDASRSDPEFLLEFARAAKEAGADRLRYCDTVGILEPFITYERISKLISQVGIDVEMHTHNDFGMATANALAGVRAGASWVGVTVIGLGERAGNAAMEEVVMALKHIQGNDLKFRTEMFREIAEYVSLASKRELPAWKPIVGSNMFAHESGIHADGALKDPRTYEVFCPEEVGLERQIVIGKHSGTSAIKAKFKEYGVLLTQEEADDILAQVRVAAVELKRPLFDKEIVYIYEDFVHDAKKVINKN
ncbi:homocitrate synthase [Syntrophaceticus schinkii]|jgi:homocitrate synthase NifV|uniref:2-isopropylmalate synthase 2 n=1 Tax=Syntrophaceticus schinkii TaxID=499207 RepID=A0A0B7MFP6_9FIRM|nr:homocitrate synthase [Syntrophaceticus schinkii]MDD2359605.1 homocitrate synthase [Syntrophaceticus schinkii]MDD4261130.1 homocitrate synthase [Syntrophaceticus schinkii]MDD4675590.1 homocitrate synthase [Syntrophaceticus schinkii]CEO89439.1 2-isopropylmalate synthase 2 [Syntrophaceticus schinkii]